MNKKNALIVAIASIALAGASASARADDMAGMDHGKMANGKNPAKGSSGDSAKKGPKKLEISITEKGFEPDKVEVKKGCPVELVFTRKTDQTCIKEVILDTGTAKLQQPVHLNTPVSFKTTFTKTGDLKYACKMNMYTGTVKVQ